MKRHLLVRLSAAVALLLLIAPLSARAAGIIYVKWDSPSNGPGTSWSNAYHTIQAGINAATWEDVWVARGTYNEHITLKTEISVYGGFAGNETSLNQRPPFPRPETDPCASIINGGGWSSHESGHLVRIPANAGYHTALDGFTVQQGASYWNDDDYPHPGTGAGILVQAGARASIRNNLIRDNISCPNGGGIGVVDASPVITGNVFASNIASGQSGGDSSGGAIACLRGSPYISGNTFIGNQATEGAAILCQNAEPVISGNEFKSNLAVNRGGAIAMTLSAGSITGNTIRSNTARLVGGSAIWLDHSSPVIQNNLVAGNTNLYGGVSAIHCWNSSPGILNNTIVGNENAAIRLLNSTSRISNNIVASNGGGIWNDGGSAPLLRSNCLYSNSSYNYGGGLGPGAGDISADPMFLNAGKGDYRIFYESPCRNAGYDDPIGLPAYDLDGQPRVEGPAVDIGADECWSRIIHVSQSPSASDANSGESWASAKRTIQAAINAATPPDRIWVARDSGGIHYNERISIKPGISLFGGFAGTETLLSQRPSFPRPAPDANQSTVDAQSNGTAVTILPDASQFTRLDGFTITRGDTAYGGALYCTLGDPTIINCTFVQNRGAEGGAIYLQAASPTIRSCKFDSNIAVNRGGAIHAKDYCYPVIERCHFTACQAQNIDGGAVFADGGGPKITGCIFEKCSAQSRGGAVRLWGSDAVLTNNTIFGNTAADGGAGAIQGAAPRLYNNLIVRNSSGLFASGGALPELYNNNVWDNLGQDYQGLSPGAGDIGLDPLLGAPLYGDFHLRDSSPCINAGANAAPYLPPVDLDGQGRKNGVVDIGADEYWPGRTYYVAMTGSDSNSGLDPAHALRTLSAALGRCIFGDYVFVLGGTYQERITLKRGVAVRTSPMAALDGGNGGTVVTVEPGADSATLLMGFIIQGGRAATGGGIHCTDASPRLLDLRVGNNSAAEGGGIYIRNGSPEIKGGWVWANSADYRGGGIHCSGPDSRPIIEEVAVFQNAAVSGDGGGMFLEGGWPVVRRCLIDNNTSGVAGGGIRGWQTVAEIAGCCLEGNTAPYGPGVHLHQSIAWLTNNTLKGNTGTVFGGGVDCADSWAWLSNNIIAFNSGGIYGDGGLVTPRNNDVYGNSLYQYWGISPGLGDISADPAFGAGCGILPASPCINTGWNDAPSLPLTDLPGNPRIAAGVVDIGAYEYPALTDSGGLKQAPEGTPVDIGGMITTAALESAFYIERPDRACGIRVETPSPPPGVGLAAAVTGRLRVNADGERYIEPLSQSFSAGTLLKPLTMSNRCMGGGDTPGQSGVQGGSGTNNVGLLVRTAGRVRQVVRNTFLLDDGAGRITSGGQTGIRVESPDALPSFVKPGAYVAVTGISSCFRSGGALYPRVLVRDVSEIVLISRE